MNNQFPAIQGTVLRQFDNDGDHRDYPVVGWMNLTGTLAIPILPVGGQTVGPGSIIITPHNEFVTELFSHPSSGLVFDDLDAAADHVGQYLAEHPLPKQAEPAATATTTAAPKSNGPQQDPKAPLHFGAKKYATKSYWSWPDQNAVFEIEAEAVYPSDARAKKVKREEYAALKRAGATKIDPHAGEVVDDQTEAAGDEETGEDLI